MKTKKYGNLLRLTITFLVLITMTVALSVTAWAIFLIHLEEYSTTSDYVGPMNYVAIAQWSILGLLSFASGAVAVHIFGMAVSIIKKRRQCKKQPARVINRRTNKEKVMNFMDLQIQRQRKEDFIAAANRRFM